MPKIDDLCVCGHRRGDHRVHSTECVEHRSGVYCPCKKFELPKPRVTVRRQRRGPHTTLTIWTNGVSIGSLCARNEESAVLDDIELLLCMKYNAGYPPGYIPDDLEDEG